MYRGEFATQVRKYATGEDGKQQQVTDWEVTDVVTTASKKVMAGILRAKADELDSPETNRNGY